MKPCCDGVACVFRALGIPHPTTLDTLALAEALARVEAMSDGGCAVEDPRSLVTSDPLAIRHQMHYRQCECLGDASECCVQDCPCHDQ